MKLDFFFKSLFSSEPEKVIKIFSRILNRNLGNPTRILPIQELTKRPMAIDLIIATDKQNYLIFEFEQIFARHTLTETLAHFLTFQHMNPKKLCWDEMGELKNVIGVLITINENQNQKELLSNVITFRQIDEGLYIYRIPPFSAMYILVLQKKPLTEYLLKIAFPEWSNNTIIAMADKLQQYQFWENAMVDENQRKILYRLLMTFGVFVTLINMDPAFHITTWKVAYKMSEIPEEISKDIINLISILHDKEAMRMVLESLVTKKDIRKLIEAIGIKRAIDAVGIDVVIREIGLEELIKSMDPDDFGAVLEKLAKEGKLNEKWMAFLNKHKHSKNEN